MEPECIYSDCHCIHVRIARCIPHELYSSCHLCFWCICHFSFNVYVYAHLELGVQSQQRTCMQCCLALPGHCYPVLLLMSGTIWTLIFRGTKLLWIVSHLRVHPYSVCIQYNTMRRASVKIKTRKSESLVPQKLRAIWCSLKRSSSTVVAKN